MKTRSRVVWSLTIILALIASVFASAAKGSYPQQPNGTAAAPAGATASGETFRFIAFGDMGTGDSNQYELARRMASYHDEHPYDTVLLLGDNIYPDGNPADLPAKFERPYAELLRRGVRF